MTRKTLLLAAAALAVCLAGQAEAQSFGLGRLLPSRSGGIDGSRGAFLEQVNTADISGRLGTDRALAFAGESGNSGRHRSLRLPMQETEARVEALIARLDAGWGDRPRYREIDVHILANRSFEAQAKPDGSVIISLGLIEKASTDEDLAFILAHELSHIRLGHFADDESFRQKRQWIQQLSGSYWTTIGLSQIRMRRSGDQTQFYDSDQDNTRQAASQAAVAYEGLQTLLEVLIEPAWTRGQEDEADALGFDLAQLAQYDAAAGSDAAIRKKGADFELRQETERHYRKQMDQAAQVWASEANQNDLQAGNFNNVANTMVGNLLTGVVRRGGQLASGYFRQEHRTPEARIAMLSRYSNTVPAYQAFVAPDEQPTSELEALRGSAEYQAALATSIAIEAATALRTQGKYTEAMAALAPALNGPFKNTPVVNNTAARILGESGDVARADRLYWKAHEHPDQDLEAFENHSRLLVDHGRHDDAKRVIAAGGRNYVATLAPNAVRQPGDEEKTFLPQLIRIAYAEDQAEQAALYLQRCVDYEEEALKQACGTAAFAPANFAGMSEEERAAAQAEIDGKLRARALTPGVGGVLSNLLGG